MKSRKVKFRRGDIIKYIEEKDKKSNFHYFYNEEAVVLSAKDHEVDPTVQLLNVRFFNSALHSTGFYSDGFKLVKRSPIICKRCPFIEKIFGNKK